MTDQTATQLLASVRTLLGVFLVDETRFPSAEGRMRYNPIDFRTLNFIDTHPGCQGADLARALNVAPTTAQSTLDRLIRQDLVEKRRHPTSARSKAYRLTPAGKDLSAAIHRQDINNMEAMLSLLDEAEKKEIVRLIGKVADAINDNPTIGDDI